MQGKFRLLHCPFKFCILISDESHEISESCPPNYGYHAAGGGARCGTHGPRGGRIALGLRFWSGARVHCEAAGAAARGGGIMCQCGCGEMPIEKAYALTRRCVLGIKVYEGCRDCFPGLAVDISVFNSAGVEWLDHFEREEIDRTVKPDEYGGNGGRGIPVPIIDVECLRDQARELVKADPIKGYRTLDAWLEEYGLALLQGAARKFSVKYAKQIAEFEARKEKS